jgi:pyruvate ferredoxin oxidoreductase alpha subunit
VLSQVEGSRAVAVTVARCRPQVVPAYPISPQTHIVEGVAELVASGELQPCEFVTVESEFGAMSVAIGASAAGARAYTATSSQGLLFMVEALYNAAGLGLPIVMTVANRALGAPINIWNDQSDSMSQRDSGWIQLYAPTNQEAADLHVLAFRLAEEVSLPVMVCMDGFVLTHAVERVDLPGQDQVDAYLPGYEPRQMLDPDAPLSIGAMVGPEAFTEVRYLAHVRTLQALERIPRLAAELGGVLGREVPALVQPYRLDGAQTVVVALGSVLGTLADAVDQARAEGLPVGVLGLTTYRPFPFEAVRAALAGVARVVVLERAVATGVGGIVTADVRTALERDLPPVHTVVAGLGGRPITAASLRGLLAGAVAGTLPPLTFLDLDTDLVARELHRGAAARRSGPTAENVLRDVRSRPAPARQGRP